MALEWQQRMGEIESRYKGQVSYLTEEVERLREEGEEKRRKEERAEAEKRKKEENEKAEKRRSIGEENLLKEQLKSLQFEKEKVEREWQVSGRKKKRGSGMGEWGGGEEGERGRVIGMCEWGKDGIRRESGNEHGNEGGMGV